MQFQVLGPLRVLCGAGEPLHLVGHRRRTILAVLLLSPNRVVDLDELIDAVWDDRPPASAKRQIQNCVSALRRELDAGAAERTIAADGLGYLVRVGDDQLDALAFQKLAAQGEACAAGRDARQAVAAFRAALRLWRGRALSGLTARAVQTGAARLNEERLATLERCVELELGLGRHHQLVSELTEAVADQPLRERLVGQLMTALRRSGRQADALREYQRLQVRLAEDLGVDPCTELQQLHLAILRNTGEPAGARQPPAAGAARLPPGRPEGLPADPSADPSAGRAGRAGSAGRGERAPTGHPAEGADSRPPGRARPEPRQCNQLPRDVADFTGRRRPVGELVDSLTAAVPGGTVTAISGKPGVGKTALAVHVGHRLCGEFPDGQLFVNLGGIGATPVGADEALLRILLLLGLRRT
ncbi:MAG TPA: BTAD domain-containing putative transcriptional regulator, partial [Micromonosporaceae bacterium]|nr:BTAD domain-containing putative transcriptional regulator [Micromonosporaceae bacterium]